MTNTEFNNQAYQDNFIQELKDYSDIMEGIFSLNWQQWVSLFDAGQPPIAVLAQACREALAEENNGPSSSYKPYVSEYH